MNRGQPRSNLGSLLSLTPHHENPIPKLMERDKWIFPVRRPLSGGKEIFPAD
jgi:hypothetical protein